MTRTGSTIPVQSKLKLKFGNLETVDIATLRNTFKALGVSICIRPCRLTRVSLPHVTEDLAG